MLGTRRQARGQGIRRLFRRQARHAQLDQMGQRDVHHARLVDVLVRDGFRRVAQEQLAQPVRLLEMRAHLHHRHAGRERARRQRHRLHQRGGGAFTGQGGAQPAVLRHAVGPAVSPDVAGAAETEIAQYQMGVVRAGLAAIQSCRKAAASWNGTME